MKPRLIRALGEWARMSGNTGVDYNEAVFRSTRQSVIEGVTGKA